MRIALTVRILAKISFAYGRIILHKSGDIMKIGSMKQVYSKTTSNGNRVQTAYIVFLTPD
jgi:hypothetical protein